jgi:hypothetical protein
MTQSVSALPRLHGNRNLAGNYYRDTRHWHFREKWVRMTTREREFADHVIEELGAGRIPGPTRLNELMGLSGGNMLSGNYSKIRIALFDGAGLVKDPATGRYGWPA